MNNRVSIYIDDELFWVTPMNKYRVVVTHPWLHHVDSFYVAGISPFDAYQDAMDVLVEEHGLLSGYHVTIKEAE